MPRGICQRSLAGIILQTALYVGPGEAAEKSCDREWEKTSGINKPYAADRHGKAVIPIFALRGLAWQK
jgi:hypothetical protein